jgi:hypothetical protein
LAHALDVVHSTRCKLRNIGMNTKQRHTAWQLQLGLSKHLDGSTWHDTHSQHTGQSVKSSTLLGSLVRKDHWQ